MAAYLIFLSRNVFGSYILFTIYDDGVTHAMTEIIRHKPWKDLEVVVYKSIGTTTTSSKNVLLVLFKVLVGKVECFPAALWVPDVQRYSVRWEYHGIDFQSPVDDLLDSIC